MTAPHVGHICLQKSGIMTVKNGIAAVLREKNDEECRLTARQKTGNSPIIAVLFCLRKRAAVAVWGDLPYNEL